MTKKELIKYLDNWRDILELYLCHNRGKLFISNNSLKIRHADTCESTLVYGSYKEIEKYTDGVLKVHWKLISLGIDIEKQH
jgi:hypothetical protein